LAANHQAVKTKIEEMVASCQKQAAGQADALLLLLRLRKDYISYPSVDARQPSSMWCCSQLSLSLQGITKLLKAKVEDMVAGAQKRAAGQADAPLLPLVRLRVDYTGFSTINAQRFGQQFVGKVANPHDLLLFQKQATRKPKASFS